MFDIRSKLRDSRSGSDDDQFQSAMLAGVSRTFALTIPQLPPPLCRVVSNAYLLCRIIDTIEDEPALSAREKRYFCREFVNTVTGKLDAEKFAGELSPRLSVQTAPAEHTLIRSAARVIGITREFSPPENKALQRCLRIMAQGMGEFQLRGGTQGLENLDELNRYCYYVAGVVGEMLTELFCLYSPETARNRESLMALAVPFGQGLQITNILKDVWEDYRRGACWLPRETFAEVGFELKDLAVRASRPQSFGNGMNRLVGVACEHLRNALAYVLLVPRRETGIRNFCLWAIGFALLTLRKIHSNLGFTDGEQVKISRLSVKATILASRLSAQKDLLLRALFYLTARSLPRAEAHGGWAQARGSAASR
jgi:farnesyl-diphosphate farnesyltransferase